MKTTSAEEFKYTVFDPTGNITALVETPAAADEQPAAAEQIMREHPEVEQVGFVTFRGNEAADPACTGEKSGAIDAELRMAGGEFCGNASMCAAALAVIRSGGLAAGEDKAVILRVSGAAGPVEVRLKREISGGAGRGGSAFNAAVRMPAAIGIEKKTLTCANVSAELPVVRMEGISHIIVEAEPVFSRLMADRDAAEAAVRKWCGELEADGLGLMFLNGGRLTPLVFVPGSGTVFWENSCASGTSAAGMYLAGQSGGAIDQTFDEPGGRLRVTSDPVSGETWLYGKVEKVSDQPDR